MLLDTPVETLDIEKCVAAWKSWEETEKDIYRIFDNDPEFVARGLVETKGKYVDKEGLRRQLQRLQKAWPALSGHIRRQIIPFGEVRRPSRTGRCALRAGAYRRFARQVPRQLRKDTLHAQPLYGDRYRVPLRMDGGMARQTLRKRRNLGNKVAFGK